MKSVILGTAGHVDHGKTALIQALTGINTDRWEEERQRGITIDLGFALFPGGEQDLSISVVDVPGHEDFVKNMLAGATGIDVLLLVVAADEGPMPQTREHLWIARLLGVRTGIIALSKTDLVDRDWLDLVGETTLAEIEEIMGGVDWPLIPTSAQSEHGLAELAETIRNVARTAPARHDEDLFRLPVDRAFSVQGVGTVVTGTVWSGKVTTGDELQVLPPQRAVRVRGVQVHGEDVDAAVAGQRAALALAGVDRDELERGMVLLNDEVWRAHDVIDAQLTVIPDSPWPLKHWQRLRFHLGTAEVMARLALQGRDRLAPGESARVQLRLESPVVARTGDRFVIRFYSPVTTVGGGVILDPWARRRRTPFDAGHIARGEKGPEAVSAAIQARDLRGVEEAELTIITGLRPDQVKSHLETLARESQVRQVGGRWFDASGVERTRHGLRQALEEYHEAVPHAPGMSLELLRSRMEAPAELVNAALADLEGAGVLRVEGSVAALSDHQPRLEERQDELAQAALAAIREAERAPPRVKELATALGTTEANLVPVLKFLERSGEVVAVSPDLYYSSRVMEDVRARVSGVLASGNAAGPSEFREVLGVSRKYLIPLLEHLDAQGLTRRTPEGRVLRKGG